MSGQKSDNTSGLRTLSRTTGSPAVDLASLVLPLELLDHVKEDLALRSLVLPLRVDHGRLFVAVGDPNDTQALDEVAFLSGKRVIAYAADPRALRETIEEAYSARRRGDVEWRGRRAERGQSALSLAALALPQAPLGSTAPVADPALTDPIAPALRQPTPPVAPPEILPPFAPDAAYSGTNQPGLPQERRRPRILVVDDEPVILKIVHQALAQRGFEVFDAPSGLDALRAVKERDPDAILLDAMLPDVHGFDIAKRLKGSRRYAHVPIVMMTAVYKGWRMAADLKESYGVAGYIEKPFNIHDVVRTLEDALAGRDPDARPNAEALSAEAQRLYSEASDAYARNDLDSAIAALASAVAVDPLSATLRHQLGLLYAQRGHDFGAIQELEMAVELEPYRFQSLRNLAVLFQRRGFRRKACEMWERALANAPDDATRREIKDLLVQLL